MLVEGPRSRIKLILFGVVACQVMVNGLHPGTIFVGVLVAVRVSSVALVHTYFAHGTRDGVTRRCANGRVLRRRETSI
jgi:hypothetical protein